MGRTESELDCSMGKAIFISETYLNISYTKLRDAADLRT